MDHHTNHRVGGGAGDLVKAAKNVKIVIIIILIISNVSTATAHCLGYYRACQRCYAEVHASIKKQEHKKKMVKTGANACVHSYYLQHLTRRVV